MDAAARAFYDRLNARKRVSLAELIDRAGVAYKTALKHIAEGHLKARRETIGGKVAWTFSETEAKRYQRIAPALVEAGLRNRGASTPDTPEGHTTIEELAARRGCSHWFIRDEIKAGRLPATRGKHGKVYIADADARAFEGPRTAKGLRISTPAALVNFLLDRIGMKPEEIGTIAGVKAPTVGRWAAGKTNPNDVQLGEMIAVARVKESLSLAPGLLDTAKAHRSAYMREYMAQRRKRPEVKQAEIERMSEYRAENRESRRAAETERYSAKRDEINAKRRGRRAAARIVENLPDD